MYSASVCQFQIGSGRLKKGVELFDSGLNWGRDGGVHKLYTLWAVVSVFNKTQAQRNEKSQRFQSGLIGTAIAAVFSKYFMVATVMNNRFYKMKLLTLLGGLMLTQGCAQKLGYIPTNQSQYPTLARLFTLPEFTDSATVMATNSQLFATGGGAGLGVYDLSYGGRPTSFKSGIYAINTDGAFPNFIDGHPANVLSMVKAGNDLYISSNAGLYQIDYSNDRLPRLNLALPYAFPSLASGYNPGGSTRPQFVELDKEKFRFDSMVYIPGANVLWGFRGNYGYKIAIGTGNLLPQLQVQVASYCDGNYQHSSAYFQGKVYVATCNGIAVFQPDASGNIVSSGSLSIGLDAVQVVATQNFLYVHHEDGNYNYSYGSSTSYNPGIYVFNSSLRMLSTIPIPLYPISFAVSPDDQVMYVNENDSDISAYRIPWTNNGIR